MKIPYQTLLLVLIACTFITCKKDNKPKEEVAQGPKQVVNFYKANSRGVVANYSADSLSFEYYGKFDASGNSQSITAFNVQSKDKVATYILDADYRLKQLIYSKNGVKENLFYSFSYNGDTLLVSLVQHDWGKSSDAVLLRTVKFAFQANKPIKANLLLSNKVAQTHINKISATQNTLDSEDYDELKNGVAPLLQSPNDLFSNLVSSQKKKFIEKSRNLAIKALKLTEFMSCAGTAIGAITADLPLLVVAAPICIISKEVNERIKNKIIEPKVEFTSDNDWQQNTDEPLVVIKPPAVTKNDPPKLTDIDNTLQDLKKSYDVKTILLSKKWLRMRPNRNDDGFPYTFLSNGTLIVRDLLRFTQWSGTWAISRPLNIIPQGTYLTENLPYQYSLSTWNVMSLITDVSFEEINLDRGGKLIAY